MHTHPQYTHTHTHTHTSQIPECQHAVVKRIQKFLDDYKSTQDQVSPLQTPLNREIGQFPGVYCVCVCVYGLDWIGLILFRLGHPLSS